MKRREQSNEPDEISFKKRKNDLSFEDKCEFIKKGIFSQEEINLFINQVRNEWDLIVYSIMKDDVELLDKIVMNLNCFEEIFLRNKVIYKKIIVNNNSHMCYQYFKDKLKQNFKPDPYYSNLPYIR